MGSGWVLARAVPCAAGSPTCQERTHHLLLGTLLGTGGKTEEGGAQEGGGGSLLENREAYAVAPSPWGLQNGGDRRDIANKKHVHMGDNDEPTD